MDNVAVRSRYPRHSTTRRKRKNVRETSAIIEKVTRQVIISILILIAAMVIKNINTPVTNYISDKIGTVLYQNIELSSIYESIDNILSKVMDSSTFRKTDDKNYNGDEEAAVPVSGSVYTPEEIVEKDANYSSNPEEDNKGQSDVKNQTAENIGKTSAPNKTSSTIDTNVQKYSFITPVAGTLGSGFGERVHPVKKTVEFHKGIDIEANKGALIKAAMQGEVAESGEDPTYGRYIRVMHDNGFVTLYAHCSTLVAKKGQKVKQGEVIAKVGDTGLSVGSHLHFEIWKDGKPLNPLDYIKVP